MNIKKLFAILAGVSMVANVTLPGLALAATPDTELGKAYEWAYSKGITTMDSYEKANMTANITRAEMAKMLSVYAKNFLGKKADTSKACTFSDIDSVKGDLHDYIIESCQLGIMGQGITEFRPYDSIPRSEFGTALSRALWGDEYNGGTPFYAKHLVALQSAGIMTQIDNAENRKEVRGYVMIMLQRAEEGGATVDCSESTIALACLDPELDAYKDCPAACRADDSKDSEKEDTKVRSGDLAVSAKAAEGKKALIDGVSDLDTITFKTSEEVTISSITLERYGYSTKEQVKSVQLEDEDGNIIADAKEINNKGQVKLTLKKDYKTVDGTFKATIVLTTNDLKDDGGNGSTIGFKVIAADSTAKNLNLDDYSPYTYDLVNYSGSAVEFSSRNSAEKTYNWEAGKLYEVAKFRVKAPSDAAILVKGFTLTDVSKKDPLDASKYAKDVTVTVDGKEVSGLKWNINKDDELVISFSEVEVEGKQTITIAVNMSFTEEFDNFYTETNNIISQYYIKQLSNFNATDKKTGTRVSEDTTKDLDSVTWTKYMFKGGKVKISGTKLGTVNAAANSTNVLVAQGEITVTESIRGTAKIKVKSNNFIDAIRLVISGEEYDGTKDKTVADQYNFSGIEIEKSGKVEVRIDLKDDADGTMEFDGSLNSASFDLQYEESRETVGSQMIGSISLSNVKAQAAKAELTNKNTKEVELIIDENNRKTIFEGTYTAKKGAVTLKDFIITTTATTETVEGLNITPAPTFYVTIDGEEYDADWSNASTCKDNDGNIYKACARNDIDDIEVADGKSISVKVEIELTPKSIDGTTNTFNIKLEGEDVDNNPAGKADDDTVKVKTVTQGTLNVNTSAKNTVLLKSDRSLAEFTIKPSKSGDSDVTLDNIAFALTDGTDPVDDVLKVVVDGDTIDAESTKIGNSTNYKPEISIPSEGVTVKVSLKTELPNAGQRVLTLTHVNDTSVKGNQTRAFTKYFLPAILKITQEKKGDITKYNVDVEKDDSSVVVKDVTFYIGSCVPTISDAGAKTEATGDCAPVAKHTNELDDTDNSMQGDNGDTAKSITSIAYAIDDKYVLIKKDDFEDYFKVNNGDYLMLFSNK